MDRNIEQQYDERDHNDNERGGAGPTSPGVETQPRGNPQIEDDEVRKGEEKLDRIVNW